MARDLADSAYYTVQSKGDKIPVKWTAPEVRWSDKLGLSNLTGTWKKSIYKKISIKYLCLWGNWLSASCNFLKALFYKKYSTDSDVWSYGMVLFEIWSVGKKPFSELSYSEVMRKINSGYCQPPPPGCPRPIYQLMVDCWCVKQPSL